MIEPVPFFDLTRQYAFLKPELDSTVARVMSEGRFILGPEVQAFEAEFASVCSVRYAVGVNSGTTAIALALMAMGIGPGDEVVSVAHTFIATAEAISMVGATPVFVDVDPTRCLMDPEELEAAITQRTRAVIPVHLYGHPADMDAITRVADRYGLPVLEDACQAHGALFKGRPVGGLGRAACFSFYPSKNLGACGEAGAIVTDDTELAERLRLLRDHGSESKYRHTVIGVNGRMEAMQAAVLRVKLRHLSSWNARRRELARWYDELLRAVPACQPIGQDPAVQSAYHLYVVRVPCRDAVREAMGQRGIGTQIHYPIPVHRQPAYAKTVSGTVDLPITEVVAGEILSLPLYPEMDDHVAERVVAALRDSVMAALPDSIAAAA
jgi:dTDP-4-amino-4,6-dideoxygalactose transaminase